jgi:hypothetical protein
MHPALRPFRATLLAFTLTVAPLQAAEAALMQVVLEGSIDRADPGNLLGVTAGDPFKVTFHIDPTELDFFEGGASIVFFQPQNSSFLIEVGRFRLREFDDFDFGDRGAFVSFTPDLTGVTSFQFRSFTGDGFGSGDIESDQLDLFGPEDFPPFFPAGLTLVEDAFSDHPRTTVKGSLRFVPEPAHLLGLGLTLLAWRRRTARTTSR